MINASHKDTSTALGKLIHDFRCDNPKEWYDSEMATKAAELKGDDETMKELEEMKAQAWKLGISEGRAEGESDMQYSIALSLIRRGKDALEEIAELCQMTLEQVQNLAATVKP